MRLVRPLVRLAGLTLFTISMLRCTDQSEIGPEKVLYVRMEPESVAVAAGDTVSVFAFPIDADSALLPNKRIIWTTENSAVATVDSIGLVRGVASGKTHVVATAGGVDGLTVVTVP